MAVVGDRRPGERRSALAGQRCSTGYGRRDDQRDAATGHGISGPRNGFRGDRRGRGHRDRAERHGKPGVTQWQRWGPGAQSGYRRQSWRRRGTALTGNRDGTRHDRLSFGDRNGWFRDGAGARKRDTQFPLARTQHLWLGSGQPRDGWLRCGPVGRDAEPAPDCLPSLRLGGGEPESVLDRRRHEQWGGSRDHGLDRHRAGWDRDGHRRWHGSRRDGRRWDRLDWGDRNDRDLPSPWLQPSRPDGHLRRSADWLGRNRDLGDRGRDLARNDRNVGDRDGQPVASPLASFPTTPARGDVNGTAAPPSGLRLLSTCVGSARLRGSRCAPRASRWKGSPPVAGCIDALVSIARGRPAPRRARPGVLRLRQPG
jgi:hypothetical protein